MQIHVLGYCRTMVAQYGHLLTSGPATYVNINDYRMQMKTQQLLIFSDFIQLNVV